MTKVSQDKRELSNTLNQILGTSIKWDKLSMNELTEVYKLFSNPPELARRLAQSEVLRRVQERIRLGEGAVMDFVMGMLSPPKS